MIITIVREEEIF